MPLFKMITSLFFFFLYNISYSSLLHYFPLYLLSILFIYEFTSLEILQLLYSMHACVCDKGTDHIGPSPLV